MIFVSNLGTVVLKILIIFQFFAVEKSLKKLFFFKVMKLPQTKKTYTLCPAVFCSSASSLIHFNLGIWSQPGSEEENWQNSRMRSCRQFLEIELALLNNVADSTG